MAFKRTVNIIFALFLVLGLFNAPSVKLAHADGLSISTYGASTDSWNTFLGGAGTDGGGSIAMDGEGNIYTSGTSNASWGNPIVPYTGSNGHRDGFLAKMDHRGNLLWNTFMGSSTDSVIYGIALDSQGNVYVAGDSSSTWGAPLNGFAGTNDVFIAKFNSADGSRLWNTFLGGTGTDYGFSITADGNGAVYVTGTSAATWGTPKNAFASLAGTFDGFAAKLDSTGTLQWNTFMGGSDYDWSYAIAVDMTGQYAFVTGDSFAAWGTPVNPFGLGSFDDGFVAKLDTSDGTREWNTFFGGSGTINGLGIVLDGSENSYVSGYSDSTWGTPISAFGGGPSDGFIAKLNSNGVLQWNSFLGGTGRDTGWGIALMGDQNLYLTGNSQAAWGDPLNPYHSGMDAFIAQLDTAGNLLWNTFIGGAGNENSYSIAVGGTGDIYILGDTSATWGTPVRNFGGAYDAYVASYPQPITQPTFLISGNAGVADTTVNYTGGSVSADNGGNYSITIPYNWSGTVTPSKSGYTFTPASRDYANVSADKPGEDYVATQATYTLTINTIGNGTVTRSLPGPYNPGDIVALTPVPDNGWIFSGWSGACTGTAACSATMDTDKTVTATFTQTEYKLTVNKVGNGVVSPDKAAPYHLNDGVILTPVADAGWTFSGWSGACTGTAACSVTMDTDKTVTATFTQTEYKLTVNKLGNGSVTPDKAEPYYLNDMVVLTPMTDAGWTFSGWSDACTGTGVCSVTMNADKTVTATFIQTEYTLTVNKVGNGVVSPDKAAPYHLNDVVILTPVADAGWTFSSWSGACTGAGACSITMNADKTVTATFTQIPNKVILGSPSGTLTSWDHSFHWKGLSAATWFYLEVQTSSGRIVFSKWYTSAQAGCASGTDCAVSPREAMHIAKGQYKWRILDYGSYGYGSWTTRNSFTISR